MTFHIQSKFTKYRNPLKPNDYTESQERLKINTIQNLRCGDNLFKNNNHNKEKIKMMFGAMQAGVATAAGGLSLKSESLADVRSPWFHTPEQASSIG